MSTSPNQLITRLKEAIDNLIDAARQVAMPRWIWLAGFLYPSIEVSLEVGNLYESVTELGGAAIEFGSEGTQSTRDTLKGLWRDLIHGGEIEFDTWIFGVPLILLVLMLPLLLFLGRLHAGLAACTSPESWQSSGDPNKVPGLRTVWAKGHGMSWSSFGISVLLGVMRIIATVLLVGAPVLFFQGFLTAGGIEDKSALFAVIYIPLAGVLILYFLVLGALHQLALHSLVENSRGMTSALRHAWRLLRVNTPISVSYLLVELSCVLVFSLTVLALGLSTAFFCILAPFGVLITLTLRGFAGVLRAAFWARAYRNMGGATSRDVLGGIGASVSQD
jgi:hypothetical protein